MNITRVKWDANSGEFLGPKLSVGQCLFMPTCTLVIPVRVVEVTDIYADAGIFPDAGEHCSIWVTTNELGQHAVQGSKEFDSRGWNVFVQRDPKIVTKECKLVNQYVWVDEPMGNELQLGSDVFLTLNEALEFIRPTRKKKLKRRLARFRRIHMTSIANTWKWNNKKCPAFQKFSNKKVYVRKK